MSKMCKNCFLTGDSKAMLRDPCRIACSFYHISIEQLWKNILPRFYKVSVKSLAILAETELAVLLTKLWSATK